MMGHLGTQIILHFAIALLLSFPANMLANKCCPLPVDMPMLSGTNCRVEAVSTLWCCGPVHNNSSHSSERWPCPLP